MTPNYFMHRAINVLDVIDHNTKPLTTEAYLDALGDDSMMLEAATLEEIAATYMYDLDTPEGAMMEAIKTTRARLPKTMAAFGLSLNKQLNSSGMEAGEAQIKAPAKSGQIAVMTALFPLSDGQSISVVFHSPSGDPSKITTHDDLVAFRFLLNKRDVTHVVAPSGGQDISLKQTCLTLSNLAERNSAKFQSKQAENKAKEDKLATMQASTEQLQTEAADTFEKADRLVEQDEADQKALSQTQAMLDKQIAKNEELRRQLAGMGGDPTPSQTTKAGPELGQDAGLSSTVEGVMPKIAVTQHFDAASVRRMDGFAKGPVPGTGWKIIEDPISGTFSLTSKSQYATGFYSEEEATAWAKSHSRTPAQMKVYREKTQAAIDHMARLGANNLGYAKDVFFSNGDAENPPKSEMAAIRQLLKDIKQSISIAGVDSGVSPVDSYYMGNLISHYFGLSRRDANFIADLTPFSVDANRPPQFDGTKLLEGSYPKEKLIASLLNSGGYYGPSQATEPSPDPAVPAEPEKVAMPTDTIRKVNQELNMDGESTLSNGAKISKVLRDEGGSLEGYITLTTPGGKSYVLKSPSSQGGPMEDTAKQLYKAYREGKAEKYLGAIPAMPSATIPEQEAQPAGSDGDTSVFDEQWASAKSIIQEMLRNRYITKKDQLADIRKKKGATLNANLDAMEEADPERFKAVLLEFDKAIKEQGAISMVGPIGSKTKAARKIAEVIEGGREAQDPAYAAAPEQTPEVDSEQSSAPAFVWDEQARASKFAELSALTNAMLQDGNGSVEIWQQVMTPNSPQVEKNPFYVDGKYEATEVTKAFQEAGYSGTVRQMFNQFADQQWAAIEQANKSPEELEEERREKERQEGVSALNKLIEGVNLPAGWSMQVDLAFGTRAALFVDTPDLPNGEEHEGYLVTANANDAGELDGTFNLSAGNGDPLSDGHTKWPEISKAMQADYQKDEAAAQPPVADPAPAAPTDGAATSTENQWGETDLDVLALLQQAEELRTTETNPERYLAELQRIGGELDKAGAVERHEPYLHTVSDRLTELMEAEGV